MLATTPTHCVLPPNFYLAGKSGISGLFSRYAHLVISFLIETLCFAREYWFLGSEKSLLAVTCYCYDVHFAYKIKCKSPLFALEQA
jgi:hypothetical protein